MYGIPFQCSFVLCISCDTDSTSYGVQLCTKHCFIYKHKKWICEGCVCIDYYFKPYPNRNPNPNPNPTPNPTSNPTSNPNPR